MPVAMLITCPKCGVKRIGTTKLVGMVVNCHVCAHTFTVEPSAATNADSDDARHSMVVPRCRTSTMIGTGTRLLHLTTRAEHGNCWATRWIVAFWLPVFPLSRDLIRPLALHRSGYSIIRLEEFVFDRVRKDRLSLREIATTLILGWCVLPVIVVGVPIAGLYTYLHPPQLVGRFAAFAGFPASLLETALLVAGAVWGIAWRLILDHRRERKLFGSRVQKESTITGLFE